MEDDDVAFELAHALLNDVSPDEAAVLRALGPGALGSGKGDGALGFGVGADTWMQVAGFVGTGVGGFLINLVCERSSEAGREVANRLIRRLRGGEAKPGDPTFTPEELERISEAARHSALAHGIEERRAELVAKAIVGAVSWPAST